MTPVGEVFLILFILWFIGALAACALLCLVRYDGDEIPAGWFMLYVVTSWFTVYLFFRNT